MISNKNTQADTAVFLLSVILVCFFAFHNLGTQVLSIWDEAWYALNAIDLAQHKNIFQLTKLGELDYSHAKPPIGITAQAISISLFGINEWAIRLPAALCLVFLSISLLRFSHLITGNYITAVVAIFFLLASHTILGPHVSRSGDMDGILMLFTTMTALWVWGFALDVRRLDNRFYIVLLLLVLAAFFSKTLQSLLPLGGILLGLILTRRFVSIIRDKMIYIIVILYILSVAAYLAIKELYQPDHLKIFWKHAGSRFGKDVHSTQGDLLFYVSKYIRNPIYLLSFVAGGISIFLNQYKKIKTLALLILCYISCYLILVSMSSTKFFWYDAPIYPMVALWVGLSYYTVILHINKFVRVPHYLTYVVALIIFGFPLWLSFNRLQTPTKLKPLEQLGYAINTLSSADNQQPYYALQIAHHEPHYNQTLFYIQKAHDGRQPYIQLIHELSPENVPATVLCCQQELINDIKSKFKIAKVQNVGQCRLLDVQ